MLRKKIGWKFDNTYSNLSQSMLSKLNPTPVKNPELVLFNHSLSKEIDLDFSQIENKELALIFSGNQLPEGSDSIAQAYAGHQFGHFTILGDGRALTIGEHLDKNKNRYDIQFKGSGITPYSRNADGRAALGPMLREYIISEAMHSLGVPTTRSLAVIKTGEEVVRESILKGAILTRVASSHIRVGTFQYALISKNKNDLKTLFDYTLKRHYPNIEKSVSPAVELLKVVLEKQIDLICNWMRIGFIHGVMNTDNMTISGETIDYGPCAFMDKYDPGTVFSSIDHQGRYSYYNQPRIAKWNLERFAESLLPLIDNDSKVAVKIATEVLKEFPEKYKNKWLKMMKKKLGFIDNNSNDEQLITELLSWMHQNKADYTNTFCYLMNKYKSNNEIYNEKNFILWKKKWEDRIKLNNNSLEKAFKIMNEVNPLVIPRNHFVEEALKQATEMNDLHKVLELLKVLKNPYDNISSTSIYQLTPFPEKNYVTYCGT
ncbi:MAG: YdiU family protein [Candidatus Pelagibacter sp. TMED153]|nr:MAG: YdiU family protein [Candidatus Pelagibacter sp. TMED153]